MPSVTSFRCFHSIFFSKRHHPAILSQLALEPEKFFKEPEKVSARSLVEVSCLIFCACSYSKDRAWAMIDLHPFCT